VKLDCHCNRFDNDMVLLLLGPNPAPVAEHAVLVDATAIPAGSGAET